MPPCVWLLKYFFNKQEIVKLEDSVWETDDVSKQSVVKKVRMWLKPD